MAQRRLRHMESAQKIVGKILSQSLTAIVTPYQKELQAIQRDAMKLQESLQELGGKISRDLSGEIRRGRRAGRKLSASARKKIAQAMKKAWARRKGKEAHVS